MMSWSTSKLTSNSWSPQVGIDIDVDIQPTSKRNQYICTPWPNPFLLKSVQSPVSNAPREPRRSSSMALPIADQIAQRAFEVRRMGEYIGAFELVVWSVLEQVEVYLVVGGAAHDVREFYGPAYPMPRGSAPAHYFVACNLGIARRLMAVDTTWAGGGRFSHYVIGAPLPGHAHAPIDPVSGEDSLRVVSLRLGFAIIETQAAGDCGIDTMCHHQGLSRTAAEFKRVRARLADFMHSHRHDPIWQERFRVCGESVMNPVHRKPTDSSASSKPSSDKPADSSSSSKPPACRSSTPASKKARLAAYFETPYALGRGAHKRSRPGEVASHPQQPDTAKDPLPLETPPLPPPKKGPTLVPEPKPPAGAIVPLNVSTCATESQSPTGVIVPVSLEAATDSASAQCTRLAHAASRPSVHQWLQAMSPHVLSSVTADYGTFSVAKAEWLASMPTAARAARGASKRKLLSISKVDHRIAVGLEYLNWAKETDTADSSLLGSSSLDSSRRQLHAFCKHKWAYEGGVPKAVKMWLTRCIKAAQVVDTGNQPWKVGPTLQRSKFALVPRQHRLRMYGLQGRPVLAPMLRENLFEWFCSLRASITVRVPSKLLMLKAKCIASEMLGEMRRTGNFVRMPNLDREWLWRFRKHYSISLKKPNKKYKVKKSVLRERLRAMWLTNVRIRAMAQACLGIDIPIYGFDQKGIYMNEAGAKNVGMLALDGETTVALKENHAASRTRVSLMTSVVSQPRELDALEHGLPIEIMFRGSHGGRILSSLEAPAGANVHPPQTSHAYSSHSKTTRDSTRRFLACTRVSTQPFRSFQVAPRGSYREEHVIVFLSRWLPEWSEERAAVNDWRMMYLDAYAAHLTVEVKDLAFERGFIVVYHGGGSTGVCQVNDTDLHAAFEREYQDAEMVSFVEQNLVDPGNIGRTRQQVVDDVVAVWRGLDHGEGVRGHKRTGLSTHLSGSEDHLINRDARTFWDDISFSETRDQEVARIREAVARGDVSWCKADIDSLRAPFPDGDVGTRIEGQEIEGDLEPGENPYTDSDSDQDEDRLSSDGEQGSTCASRALVPVRLPIEAADTPEEVQEATRVAARLQTLQKIEAAAKESQLPAVQFHVQREMRNLTKLARSEEGQTAASALLRRFVRQRREDEERRFRACRTENHKRAQDRAKVKAAARKLRVTKELASAAAKERKEILAKLPARFDDKMLGQGHPDGGTRTHCAARIAFLERLRLRAPPLSRELKVTWCDFSKDYARWMGVMHKAAVGVRMLEVARDTMAALGDHLLPEGGSEEAAVSHAELLGDPGAFSKFMKKARGRMPRPANSLVI